MPIRRLDFVTVGSIVKHEGKLYRFVSWDPKRGVAILETKGLRIEVPLTTTVELLFPPN